MQHFKGDDKELKFELAAASVIDLLSFQKDDFLNNAYSSFPLGDLLYTENRTPLSNAILQSIFRESFSDIYDAFVVAGSFESYLGVFRKIFGDDVAITFTVPAAGKLDIDIVAAGLEESDFISRYIVSNSYVYDYMVDDVGDNIVFQTVKGFQTQYELEQMLYELVPAGIFTTITLTIA